MPPLALKEGTGHWHPTSIHKLVELLEKGIRGGRGYIHCYALTRNIAYNLQYLQYLERTLLDLKLTSVLETQTWKTQIIVGCGVIESLLHYLIIASGNQATADWEVRQEFTGVNKTVDGKIYRIDSVFKQKLALPKPVEMTFDAMLKKAESKRLLGEDHTLYSRLKRLRPLRNRVHLQAIATTADHDFNAFTNLDQRLMMQVVHAVFTGATFTPSVEQRRYFAYLDRYNEPIEE
ncbi:hypothetical protein [Novilysobacter erysipheiresistens]|uniref:Uncharacterized protein n=1 Tax=Novilysobacter erysipheiresistens TaxID=1749332 RepID=A0ABU7YUE3_9GAMM